MQVLKSKFAILACVKKRREVEPGSIFAVPQLSFILGITVTIQINASAHSC